MKRSKRINRNLSLIGIVILGFLVLVFGQPMFDELVEYTHNQGDNWTESWAKLQMEKIKEILEK